MLASLVFLGVRFYQRHIEILPKAGGEYVEAIVGQPQHINPVLNQVNDSDMDLTRLIYAGLMKFDEKSRVIPDLAERYEISEDQKTYTIVLKENLTWQDGNPLTSDDVVFTVQTIQNPDTMSPLAPSFKGINIEAVDDRTVRFTLPEPFAPFLSTLTFGILPAHLWSDVIPSNIGLAEFNLRPIGSGPYQFESLQKSRSGDVKTYTIVAFEGYHGGPPHISKITFKLYPDFDTAIEAFKNKQVEGVSFVPRSFKTDVEQHAKDARIYSFRLPQYAAVFFYQKNALLKDKNIRQALAMAVNKEEIVREVLGNDGVVSQGPIPEWMIGYHSGVKTYPYDLQAAQKLLDDSGWAYLAGNEVRVKKGAELRFTLTTVDQPEYVKTAQMLQQYWQQLHIAVNLNIVESGRFDRDVLTVKNYEALLYGEIVGYDPDPFPFWHSSQSIGSGLNLAGYVNKAADKLLEDARKISDENQRAAKYVEFQNILAEDLPALFLYSPNYLYGVDEEVKGIGPENVAVPSDRFNAVTQWFVKTNRKWK